MNSSQFWRSFSLNRELHVAGGFIYDGMRELRTLRTFARADEVFQIVYPLAVGFERLLKIAIVLLEYREGTNQAGFEKSLITHSHLELLKRVKAAATINLDSCHNEFLQILGKFYKSYRYDRFSINSVSSSSQETEELLRLLRKHVAIEGDDEVFGEAPRCPDEARAFLARVCQKISRDLYEIIYDAASAVATPLFTYELRCDSKASKVFLSEELDFLKEDLLWKEILVFLMNSREETPELKFLREIEPLEFDPGMISEYLECLGSDTKKLEHIEELNELYKQVENPTSRQQTMDVIGGGLFFLDESFEEGE